MIRFQFPVGYIDFHDVQIINFLLNRWYSSGYARREDMEEAVKRFEHWMTGRA